MVKPMLAHGTEQGFIKSAVPTAPDHQKISVCCCVEQHLRGVAFPHLWDDWISLPESKAELIASVTVASAAFWKSALSIIATGAGKRAASRRFPDLVGR